MKSRVESEKDNSETRLKKKKKNRILLYSDFLWIHLNGL